MEQRYWNITQMVINAIFFLWLLYLSARYEYLHNWVKNIYNWIHLGD